MTEHLMRGKLANMRKQADVLTGFPDPRIFASTCRTLALHLQDLRRSVSKESESNGGNNVLSNYTRYLFSEINRGEAEYFWRLPPDKLSKELQELSEFIKLAAGSGSIARAVKAQAIELATNIRDAYDRMFAPAVQAYTPRLKLVVNNR